MSRAQKQFGAPVPDSHDHLVAVPQGLERGPADSSESKITNLDDSTGIH
jgi:hypothetical protein